MRSIASQWRAETRREPLITEDAIEVGEPGHDPVGSYETTDLIERMLLALGTDVSALGVLKHILADSDRMDAQSDLGMTATQYDTARRRMVRRLFDAFSAGWNDEPQCH